MRKKKKTVLKCYTVYLSVYVCVCAVHTLELMSMSRGNATYWRFTQTT